MKYICIVLVGVSYIAFYLYSRYVIRESVFLIVFLLFLLGFAGKLNTKLTEADHIHIGKHYGSMSLASTEIRDLFQGKACGIGWLRHSWKGRSGSHQCGDVDSCFPDIRSSASGSDGWHPGRSHESRGRFLPALSVH